MSIAGCYISSRSCYAAIYLSWFKHPQEVDRPFDEEYDDDFEGEAASNMRGGRQKKRRPGLIMFDGDGEEGVL